MVVAGVLVVAIYDDMCSPLEWTLIVWLLAFVGVFVDIIWNFIEWK